MKYVSTLFIFSLVIMTFSPMVNSEESQQPVINCEQQAADLGLQEGEDFDSFVADCSIESAAAVGSEEISPEPLSEQEI